MNTKERMERAEENRLFRYLKPDAKSSATKLMLCEVDGDLWWSDGYLLVPVDDAMRRLLARYNLSAEPMFCRIKDTIVRLPDQDPPGMQGVVDKVRSAPKTQPIKPVTLHGEPVVLAGGIELWSTDGGKTADVRFNEVIANMFRRSVDKHWPSWVATNASRGPVAAIVGGRCVGVIMPMSANAQVIEWADAA